MKIFVYAPNALRKLTAEVWLNCDKMNAVNSQLNHAFAATLFATLGA